MKKPTKHKSKDINPEILKILKKADGILEVKEILEGLKKRGIIPKSRVIYQKLERLHQEGLVNRICLFTNEHICIALGKATGIKPKEPDEDEDEKSFSLASLRKTKTTFNRYSHPYRKISLPKNKIWGYWFRRPNEKLTNDKEEIQRWENEFESIKNSQDLYNIEALKYFQKQYYFHLPRYFRTKWAHRRALKETEKKFRFTKQQKD